MNPKNKFIDNEIKKIEILKKKISIIKKSKLSHIQKIYYLINDWKTYGTLAFAGIARCAFISKSILDSLRTIDSISVKDLEGFNKSINTISKQINFDYYEANEKKSFKNFIADYGHLRPSTYSIMTQNYRENHRKYFSKSVKKENFLPQKNFKFATKKIYSINRLFKNNNLDISFKKFLNFAKKSIEYREYSKLVFTKSIDEIFYNLKNLAKETNININKFQHLDIDVILKSFNNLEQDRLRNIIKKNININEKSYKFSRSILTPDVITSEKDFYYFKNLNNKENYITQKTEIGEIIELNKLSNLKLVKDKIILIENADPGFDFLFSHKIKGLITKYGGSNSHMAIRCMELGLPAIIGVGDQIYDHLTNSKKIFIDCNNKKYSIIH